MIAALLHCLNHGLFKGGLFLGAGAVQHATGTRDMDKLGGLAKYMPRTTVMWLISAASIAGVPLFNGFVSKWLLYVAALNAGFPVPALLACVVSVFTMFSFMKASSGMFFGSETEASAGRTNRRGRCSPAAPCWPRSAWSSAWRRSSLSTASSRRRSAA